MGAIAKSKTDKRSIRIECNAAARGGVPRSNIFGMRYQIILASAAFSMLAWAQAPQVVPIWPAGTLAADAQTQQEVVTENAAHEHTVTNIHNPTITAYLPPAEKATGVAIVIAQIGRAACRSRRSARCQ